MWFVLELLLTRTNVLGMTKRRHSVKLLNINQGNTIFLLTTSPYNQLSNIETIERKDLFGLRNWKISARGCLFSLPLAYIDTKTMAKIKAADPLVNKNQRTELVKSRDKIYPSKSHSGPPLPAKLTPLLPYALMMPSGYESTNRVTLDWMTGLVLQSFEKQ